MVENNTPQEGRLSQFKKKSSALCRNHWFLAGVTAGVTFFILTALAAAGVTHILEPDFFENFIEAIEDHID